jgi:D-glycero-D-manno-heptose 1,7-bisphosphate phosphatase
MPQRRAVFLDRDGTVNENRSDHVKSLDEFVLLPGAIDAIGRLARSSLAIVIVTNQSVVNRKQASAQTVQAINRWLVEAVQGKGGRIDAVYFCPHLPEEQCECRKPRPGLFLQAQAEHDLQLRGSYVVGDAVTDVEVALALDAQPILVLTGRGAEAVKKLTPEQRRCTHICADLSEAVTWILARED